MAPSGPQPPSAGQKLILTATLAGAKRTTQAEAIAEAALAFQQEIVRHEAPNGETLSLRMERPPAPCFIATRSTVMPVWFTAVSLPAPRWRSG